VLWNTASVVFNQGSTFAANLIVANVLGRATFGAYAIVLSTVQAVVLLASLGMGSTATRYLSEFRGASPRRAGRILGYTMSVAAISAIAFALTLSIGSAWIASSVLKAPQLGGLLRIAGAAALFFALNNFLMGALAGLNRFSSLGRVNALAGLFYLVAAGLGAVEWGLKGAVVALATSGAVQLLLLYPSMRRAAASLGVTPEGSGLGPDRRIVRAWMVPSVIGGFTSTGALWALQAIMTRQTAGLSMVALYGAAYSLITVVLFLPNVANSVGMTFLNDLLGARDEHQYRSFFWHNLKVTLAVVVTGAVVVAVMGPLLLRMYGKSFSAGTLPLTILLAATVPESLTIALSQIVLARERIWRSILTINLPRDLGIVIAALIFVPRYGTTGAALAYLIGRVVGALATTFVVARLGLALPPDALVTREAQKVLP
jgi:O-antigen/teichoic acid export membrane protein